MPAWGDGNRLALEIVERLRREFAIDERRIYLTGQSMGGAGVWNLIAQRPTLCGDLLRVSSTEDGTAIGTPIWNFHGDADRTVPVSVSRDRIAARRKAGGRPLHTEYAGVDHNCWQWAYTEAELPELLFAQRRAN